MRYPWYHINVQKQYQLNQNQNSFRGFVLKQCINITIIFLHCCLFEQLFYFLNIGPSLNSFSNLAILEMISMFRLKNHMADIDIYCLQIWLAVSSFKKFTWFSATVIISLCLSFLESPEYHGLLISFVDGF